METNSFALLEFDSPMTQNQQKLYYLSASLIRKGDDPEENQLYTIDIRDMARAMEVTPASLKNSLNKVVDIFTESNVKLRTAFDIDEKHTAVILGIYQTIVVDKDDPYTINIRFNYDFRKKMLEMKKVHDIEYPVQTILDLDGKYAISLYVFLIANASVIRDEQHITDGRYDISVTKERLMQALQFEGTNKNFTNKLLLAVKNLNERSEIYIENGTPEIIKKGRSISEYIFHIRITTTISNPIFSKSILKPGELYEIPEWDYLMEKAKFIGADESFRKRMRISNDRRRCWKSILYTLIMVGRRGAYLNPAFSENWAKPYSIQHLIRTLKEMSSQYTDEYIDGLAEEYQKHGDKVGTGFFSKLYEQMQQERKNIL